MYSGLFSFLFVAIFIVYVVSYVMFVKRRISKTGTTTHRFERSSDGHIVSADESFTCETKEGHNHPKISAEFGQRYIVHNDPEDGYVILNGVRRKLDDCSRL